MFGSGSMFNMGSLQAVVKRSVAPCTRGLRALVLGAVAFAAPATAADWSPPGPIQMMIAYRAGGGADTQARLIAEELENRRGWKLIPENVTGQGGLAMAAKLRKAPADGTAIGIVAIETLGYNMRASNSDLTLDDFTMLTTTAGFQMGIVAQSARGWKTLADAIEASRDDKPLRFGVMSPKLADLVYVLGRESGARLNIVELPGGRAVLDGIIAGDLDAGMIAGVQSSGVASGDLVNLASAMSEPLVQSPEAPLIGEFGVPFNADGGFIFVAPAGLPDEARTALAQAIGEVLSDPATKPAAFVERAFGGALLTTGEELDTLVRKAWDDADSLMTSASD